MTDLDKAIEAIFTLVIVFLLGYVFIIAFATLSPILAFFFAIALVVVVIGIIYGILRGR